MLMPLIIDTDMAFDDWLALAYLTQCASVDIQAVTIAATGESHAKPGMQSALRILQLRNLTAPVSSGRVTPLQCDHVFPWFIRLAMDLRLFLPFPKTTRKPNSRPAKDLLHHLIETSPQKVSLLALGPLTNLAEVLLEHPQLVESIAMIYIMGGAINVAGNLTDMYPKTSNRHAECNIYMDPYAAHVVFSSGAPITLFPLDVTNRIPLDARLLTKLQADRQTPAADFASRIIKRMVRMAGKTTLYMWDVVAAVVASHPEIATFTPQTLRVTYDESVESGRILAAPDGSVVQVCTQVDQVALENLFLTTLNRS